jgi:hypothetical protein
MVSFSKYLSPDQVESIRAYILTEARRDQAGHPSTPQGGKSPTAAK